MLCPKCRSILKEKTPKDERQLSKVVRFYCPCGYYKDIPFKEVKDINKGLIG
jgi:RNase P subunit RPR2